jgi:hypothetical protein
LDPLFCFRFFFGGETASESSSLASPGVELAGVSDFTFDSVLIFLSELALELLCALVPFVWGFGEGATAAGAGSGGGAEEDARSKRSIIRA